jgi:hypothetical protein
MFFESMNEHITDIDFHLHEEDKKMQVKNLSHRKVNLLNQES